MLGMLLHTRTSNTNELYARMTGCISLCFYILSMATIYGLHEQRD